MDDPAAPGTMTRGPIDAIRTSLRNGINRYRSMKDARESRWLLAGFLASIIALRFNTVVLVVLSYQLGEGALGVGGMLAIQMIPGIFLQPFAGSLVDRFRGKHLLTLCQAAMALISLGYLLPLHFDSIWLLYVMVFARGVIYTLDAPGYEVRLVALTPTDKRGTANALQSLAMQLGEVAGPLLGGLLLAILGSAPVFILSAVIYVGYGALLQWLPDRVAGAGRVVEEGSDEEAENLEAIKQGYRGILRRPATVLYFLQVGGSYLLVYGLIPLFIVRALELGMTEASVGVFYAVMGFGGLFGGIFSGMGTYTSRQALAITGATAAAGGVAIMLFGIAGTPILAFALLMLIGVLGEIEEIPAITYFQNTLPEGIFGRFFLLFSMVSAIGGLGGSLLAPLLADRFSTVVALTVLGIPMVLFGLLLAIRAGGLQLNRHPFTMAATAPGISASHPEPRDASADESTDFVPEGSPGSATRTASD